MSTEEKKQVNILLPLALNNVFTYTVPKDCPTNIGDYVEVPLGRKKTKGVVWSNTDKRLPEEKVKPILTKYNAPAMDTILMKFIEWVANYTLSPKGNVLKMTLCCPKALEKYDEVKNVSRGSSISVNNIIKLSSDQQNALNQILKKSNKGQFSTTLLDGVTGSGKTEVFFSAIQSVLRSKGGQALIMLPEIILTTHIIERVKNKYGIEPTVWHSNLTPAMRRKNWLKIVSGQAQIVIGARSALFLPYKKLSIVVVDEEHDTSYKQEEGVPYHARDMAVKRASMHDIPIILSSATPSVETINNISANKYNRIELPTRYKNASMPDIHIIDMKKNKKERHHWISETLINALAKNLANKNQSLLFLNRRGYAPLILCSACGTKIECPNCQTWLVEHKKEQKLRCHHCDYSIPYPKKCASCGAKGTLTSIGPGVERIEEEIKERLPQAKQLLITSDTLKNSKDATSTINTIINQEIDIIIGTQILAKGLHFPKLTLVGAIDTDIGLSGGDLRASEKTYQLLHQVSGRAGREKEKGHVYLQSYYPENRIIQALASQKRESFLSLEIESRKNANMPPYTTLTGLILSGFNQKKVENLARAIVRKAPVNERIRVLGPAPAPLFKIRNRYRYRILIRSEKTINIQKWIKQLVTKTHIPASIKLKIDVDPYNFL